jgi:hypothetical protein
MTAKKEKMDAEEKSGVLEQVNPLKLFNNFRNRGGSDDK